MKPIFMYLFPQSFGQRQAREVEGDSLRRHVRLLPLRDGREQREEEQRGSDTDNRGEDVLSPAEAGCAEAVGFTGCWANKVVGIASKLSEKPRRAPGNLGAIPMRVGLWGDLSA